MISVIILTKNEEERIEACIKSVDWVDEIIVADSESTDRTVEIARKLGAKVITRPFDNYVNQKNWAFEHSKGDWVLYIDADERILKPLRDELMELTKRSDFSAYALSRRNIIFGQEVKYDSFWPDWIIRLVKREAYKGWVGEVHETLKFSGELGYTQNSLLHLTHRNLDQIIPKSLLWSKIDANLRLNAQHPPMSGWRLLRIFVTETFEQGFRKRGFFSGTIGVMDSLLQIFSMIMTYIRLWEFQQKVPLEKQYQELDQKLVKDGFNI